MVWCIGTERLKLELTRGLGSYCLARNWRRQILKFRTEGSGNRCRALYVKCPCHSALFRRVSQVSFKVVKAGFGNPHRVTSMPQSKG